MMKPIQRILPTLVTGTILPPLVTGTILIAAWYAIKYYFRLHDFILPAPHQIVEALFDEWPRLLNAARITIFGSILGFSAAVSLGFCLSLLLATIRLLRLSIYPYVVIMQMMPILATAAIIVILFDVGLQSVALIAFLIGFFPVIASTLQGLVSVPESQIEMFRLYRASRWQELFFLRVPYCLPYFFTGAKIAATLAVIGSVTGEIFAGSTNSAGGLGFLIIIYKSELKIPAIYAATFICCLLGFAFVGTVLYIKWLCLHKWHDSAIRPES